MIVRLVGRRVPVVLRHRLLLPASTVTGAVVVVGSDVLLRTVFGPKAGVTSPPACRPRSSAPRCS